MRGIEKLLTRFKPVPSSPSLIHIRPDLLASLEEMAQQHNKPVATVVNELLRTAVLKRQSAKVSLQTWEHLTPREKEVSALVWHGLTNPQIAHHLIISPFTVKAHIRNICAKFEVRGKKELRHVLADIDFSDWVDMLMTAANTPTNGG